MTIKNKETFYIFADNTEHIVRQGTVGVEKHKVVYFYDVTKSTAVGFARSFCLENHNLFSVSRNIEDVEVPKKDVLEILAKTLPNDIYASVETQIMAL